MTTDDITSATVSVAGGFAGAEGLWRLESKRCTKQTLEELDKLLNSSRFFETQDEDNLLMKYARDLRTTVVSIAMDSGQQHTVTVPGLGDSTSFTDLITFIKVHGTEVIPAVG